VSSLSLLEASSRCHARLRHDDPGISPNSRHEAVADKAGYRIAPGKMPSLAFRQRKFSAVLVRTDDEKFRAGGA
jgi:hypothetical protein